MVSVRGGRQVPGGGARVAVTVLAWRWGLLAGRHVVGSFRAWSGPTPGRSPPSPVTRLPRPRGGASAPTGALDAASSISRAQNVKWEIRAGVSWGRGFLGDTESRGVTKCQNRFVWVREWTAVCAARGHGVAQVHDDRAPAARERLEAQWERVAGPACSGEGPSAPVTLRAPRVLTPEGTLGGHARRVYIFIYPLTVASSPAPSCVHCNQFITKEASSSQQFHR